VTVIPTIQSVGLPPEEHADRVVAEMLRYLVRGRLAREREIKAALILPDGNPRAQAKLARKLEERGWPFVLDVSLRKTGKRGRYELNFVGLDGWSTSRGQIIIDEQNIPHKPWISISLNWIVSKGNHSYDERSVVAVLITHHALSRLAQRSGVKTVSDLLMAVNAIWSAYTEHVYDRRGIRFPEGHRLTFQLHSGGNALAVLNHHRTIKDSVVVNTII
jgi:hypothetical protein